MPKKIKDLKDGDEAVIGETEVEKDEVEGTYTVYEVPTPKVSRLNRDVVERKRASAVALVAKYDSLIAEMDKADDGIEEPVIP